MLRMGLASVLSLAALPSIASAQEASTAPAPTMDDWPMASPIGGPVWTVTTGEASLRATPDMADNRFGFARTGTPLQVLSTTSNGWSYVFNPHTQGTAYVSSALLAPGNAPSEYVSKPAPALLDQLQEQVVVTQDSILATYPTPVDSARFGALPASTIESVVGTVTGDDGATWYQTSDFYYFPANGVFQPSAADDYTGRWLRATLLPVTKVIAFEGQTAVRSMYALRGIAMFPTPTGTFSILRRVPNETMDSLTVGIPHDSPYGYLVKNVLYTQYFTGDGSSLHDNYWSSNFGAAGSHGCLGLSLGDSKWLWDWASIGVPVIVNAA
jgi:hypothetical protein